jgi:hypothetical protein
MGQTRDISDARHVGGAAHMRLVTTAEVALADTATRTRLGTAVTV